MVIAAIGVANVVFAIDSIRHLRADQRRLHHLHRQCSGPDGRQLYFLIGGLLEKVSYLNKGLAVIPGFIGIKLILEALHGSRIDDIGSVHLPEIGTVRSLLFIVVTLAVTTIVSLFKTRRDARRTVPAAAE
jgi:predicted tellurium resistance membrane protein TerC